MNVCGNSQYSCKSLTRFTAAPANAGTISGPATICGPLTATYSVAPAANATSYNWTLLAPGATIASGQGTNSITVNFNPNYVVGILAVQASNCIGSGSYSFKLILGQLVLAPVFTATNNPTVGVCGGSTKTYEIFVPGTRPPLHLERSGGSVITSSLGQSGNPLTVDSTVGKGLDQTPSGFSSGTVSVYATNACGNSPVASLSVRSTPLVPPRSAARRQGLPFEQSDLFDQRSDRRHLLYRTVPSGATITNNSGTSIRVTFGNSFTGSGNITVKANNACGSSAVTSLLVKAALLNLRASAACHRLQITDLGELFGACRGQHFIVYLDDLRWRDLRWQF